jgi:calpain
MSEEVKTEIGLTFDNDGEFWMSYQDFLKYFDIVEICNLTLDSLSEKQISNGKKSWEMSTFEGQWVTGVSAGGRRSCIDTFHNNPQYSITLEDPDKDDEDAKCAIIVTLMQKNRRTRCKGNPNLLSISYAIYKVTDHDLAQKPIGTNFFKYNASVGTPPEYINLREVSWRFKLDPGQYLIVPCTYEPNNEAEFLIRVFSECAHTMEENDETIGYGEPDHKPHPNLPNPFYEAKPDEELEELFLSVAGSNEEIGWIELKKLLDALRDDRSKEKNNNEGIHTEQPLHNKNQTHNSNKKPAKQEPVEDNPGILCGLVQTPEKGFSKDICRSMVAMMDVDMSGKLGLVEFKQLWTDIKNWKAAFKMYDTTGSGKLETFGLRAALSSAGYQLNSRIVNALGYRYRSDTDGSITFNDFIMCAIKLKTMIDIFQDHVSEKTGKAEFNLDEWVTRTVYS